MSVMRSGSFVADIPLEIQREELTSRIISIGDIDDPDLIEYVEPHVSIEVDDLVLEVSVNWRHDPGVRYYPDGSGTPPSGEEERVIVNLGYDNEVFERTYLPESKLWGLFYKTVYDYVFADDLYLEEEPCD